MVAAVKIDSNATGLRYAEEVIGATLGTLPGTPDWIPLEPNGYDDFGGSITTKARNPINDSRQRKKGVVVDLDANGGFGTDVTQTNLQDILQGFFFADHRIKGEELVTVVDVDSGNPDEYEVAATGAYQVDDLIQGQNFTNAANNAVNAITAIVLNTSVEVADGVLIAEASPPATARIVNVGHAFVAGEVEIDVTNPLPRLVRTTGAKDFTDFGLIPGEWMYIGSDGAGTVFTNAENNGFKRIRSVAATYIEFDKSDSVMVVESAGSLTVNVFFGRVLKNELAALIKRRSYNFERTLGAPDGALTAEIQAEYLEGQVPGEVTFNIPTADIMTADLSFMGTNSSTIDGPTSLKTGNRPSLVETDAFNTSSDFSRIKLAAVSSSNEAPDPLFAFASDITITLNNNLSPNKAVGTLGSFDVTAGTFQVSGSLEVYFADVAAIESVRANTSITLDIALSKNNAGIVLDVPLITLGDGRPNIEQDEPIKLPLDMDAATAASIDPTLDYTMMMVFFDYLPTVAAA